MKTDDRIRNAFQALDEQTHAAVDPAASLRRLHGRDRRRRWIFVPALAAAVIAAAVIGVGALLGDSDDPVANSSTTVTDGTTPTTSAPTTTLPQVDNWPVIPIDSLAAAIADRLLVANPDGIYDIGGDALALDTPAAVAIDDLRGGFVFQEPDGAIHHYLSPGGRVASLGVSGRLLSVFDVAGGPHAVVAQDEELEESIRSTLWLVALDGSGQAREWASAPAVNTVTYDRARDLYVISGSAEETAVVVFVDAAGSELTGVPGYPSTDPLVRTTHAVAAPDGSTLVYIRDWNTLVLWNLTEGSVQREVVLDAVDLPAGISVQRVDFDGRYAVVSLRRFAGETFVNDLEPVIVDTASGAVEGFGLAGVASLRAGAPYTPPVAIGPVREWIATRAGLYGVDESGASARFVTDAIEVAIADGRGGVVFQIDDTIWHLPAGGDQGRFVWRDQREGSRTQLEDLAVLDGQPWLILVEHAQSELEEVSTDVTLHLMALDTGEQRLIVELGGYEGGVSRAAYSPTFGVIAVTQAAEGFTWVEYFTPEGIAVDDLPVPKRFEEPGWVDQAVFSPDGRQIVYLASDADYPQIDGGTYTLRTLDLDSGVERVVVEIPAPDRLEGFVHLDYDGSTVVVSRRTFEDPDGDEQYDLVWLPYYRIDMDEALLTEATPGGRVALAKFRADTTPTVFTVATAEGDVLNVRSGPGTSFPVLASLSNGTPVVPTGQSTGRNAGAAWWEIVAGDAAGWVHSGFLAPPPAWTSGLSFAERPCNLGAEYVGSAASDAAQLTGFAFVEGGECDRYVIALGSRPGTYADAVTAPSQARVDGNGTSRITVYLPGIDSLAGTAIDAALGDAIAYTARDSSGSLFVALHFDRNVAVAPFLMPNPGRVVLDISPAPTGTGFDLAPVEGELAVLASPVDTTVGDGGISGDLAVSGYVRPFEAVAVARLERWDGSSWVAAPATWTHPGFEGGPVTDTTDQIAFMVTDWTSAWGAFEFMIEALPPGDYRLFVGQYNQDDGQPMGVYDEFTAE